MSIVSNYQNTKRKNGISEPNTERANLANVLEPSRKSTTVIERTDQEAYKKGFEENQGRYLAACAIYRTSTLDRMNFFSSVILIGGVLPLLYKAASLVGDDLTLMYESLFWSVLITGILAGFPGTLTIQSRFRRIFTTLGKGIYSYTIIDEETAEEIQKLRTKGKKEKDLLKKGMTVLAVACGFGFTAVLPGLAVYSGKFFEPQRSDGVVEGVPCVLWLPVKVVDDKIILVRICLMLMEFWIAFTTVTVIIAVVSFEICVGHTLQYEFKVLALAINNCDKRAKSMVHSDSITEWNAILIKSMEDAIGHHEVLLKVVEDYVAIFYYPLLLFMVTNTLTMCLSATSLFSDIPFWWKVLFFLFTISELANTFVLCYYGHVLLDAHDLIRFAVYDYNWVDHSALLGKHVHITLIRTLRPLSLSMGGFAEVNLDTWSQVIKTAFSYFSILQALK